ncbi:hypothetical protein BH10BAC3_BH10BAC3_21780 [soil metagenome]
MKKYLIFLLLPAFALLQYCSSSKKAKAPAATVAKFTFEDHVKPLVSASCAPCHTTGNKLHLLAYNNSMQNIDSIIYRVKLSPGEKGFMPFKHDKLSDSAINVFVKWKADGLLEKSMP